jgi:hypothetical protein
MTQLMIWKMKGYKIQSTKELKHGKEKRQHYAIMQQMLPEPKLERSLEKHWHHVGSVHSASLVPLEALAIHTSKEPKLLLLVLLLNDLEDPALLGSPALSEILALTTAPNRDRPDRRRLMPSARKAPTPWQDPHPRFLYGLPPRSASCVAGCGDARRSLGRRWSRRVREEELGVDVAAAAATNPAGWTQSIRN